jgi:hypothetical protein
MQYLIHSRWGAIAKNYGNSWVRSNEQATIAQIPLAIQKVSVRRIQCVE